MNAKQNPFSLYDFLGYFTPGAIFLYCALLGYAHTKPDITAQQLISSNLGFDQAEIYIPFVLASYAIGHLLSFLSSLTVERFSIWTHGYPSKYLLELGSPSLFGTEKGIMTNITRVITSAIILPISVLDILFGQMLGFKKAYRKPLDKVLRVLINKKLNKLITQHGDVKNPGELVDAKESDFFRYAYHYAVEFAPNHLPKMQNYVALYGFLRTLSLLSVIITWGVVWHAVFGTINASHGVLWISLSAITSYLLYLSFMKFYRRFSLEALMAVAVIYKSEPSADAK